MCIDISIFKNVYGYIKIVRINDSTTLNISYLTFYTSTKTGATVTFLYVFTISFRVLLWKMKTLYQLVIVLLKKLYDLNAIRLTYSTRQK